MESRLNFQRLFRFHVENDHRALFAHGNEKRFANAERISRVQDRGGLRPNGNGPRQCLSRQQSPFGVKFQVKVAKHLQRVHPRFHAPGFIPQQSRARSGDGQKFPRAHRARKLQLASSFLLCLLAPACGCCDSENHCHRNACTKQSRPHAMKLFLKVDDYSRCDVHSSGPRCDVCLHCLVGLTIKESAGF